MAVETFLTKLTTYTEITTVNNGWAVNPIIQTPTGVFYRIYIDSTDTDVYYEKSTDYGITWAARVAIKASISGTQVACWADWWSGITATSYIHVAYTDANSNDTFYNYIDTANSDTLGTERTVLSGSSVQAGGSLSITRARGGNLICATCIDAGAEYDTVKSTDLFVNKTSIAEVYEGATNDQVILLPGWAADNQDVMAYFWDASADEISRKLYDDSGDSWAESSIAGTMVDNTAVHPNFYGAVDITNSQNVLVAWSAVDTANADLRCWKITEAAITEVTNVVLNSTDDQGMCGICIDSARGIWYVIYGGISTGTYTWPTADFFYKISTDQGTTWGTETKLTSNLQYLTVSRFCPIFYGNFIMFWAQTRVTCPILNGVRASFQLGM